MEESWKDIDGFDGYYQVSNLGRIRNKTHNILATYGNGTGYEKICLTRNYAKSRLYVHRIVAKHFVENPMHKDFVNHKDYNRKNNKAENLEWLTRSENNCYSNWKNRKPMVNCKTSKTGERYIYTKKNGFYVHIKQIGYYRSALTLSDAVIKRNEGLKRLFEHYSEQQIQQI